MLVEDLEPVPDEDFTASAEWAGPRCVPWNRLDSPLSTACVRISVPWLRWL